MQLIRLPRARSLRRIRIVLIMKLIRNQKRRRWGAETRRLTSLFKTHAQSRGVKPLVTDARVFLMSLLDDVWWKVISARLIQPGSLAIALRRDLADLMRLGFSMLCLCFVQAAASDNASIEGFLFFGLRILSRLRFNGVSRSFVELLRYLNSELNWLSKDMWSIFLTVSNSWWF